ncbi:MAG: hypothetical protein V4598_03340 [Bdellovibrionota bacterium]
MLKFGLLFFLLTPVFASVIDAPVNPIDFEQNPSSVEWRKIDTKNFELIFPEEVTEDAKRVAHLLEKLYPFVTRSMEVSPPKLSLVLQNQSTISNAFVTLAPRRSEWYMSPAIDPELSSTEWLKTLAIHEFRHVVQFERGREGFNKILEFFLGEVGQAIGLGLTAPPWVFEGDAVGVETALTNSGRGRLPLFERDLRTLLLSGKKYDYDRTHLGSFKEYIPNHYVYGYFYTTYMRNKLGDNAVSQVMYHSAQNSWNPLSFYNTMDDTFRKDFEKFYQDVMSDLITHWKKKYEELNPTPFEVKSPGKEHGWTNYAYPQVTDDGKILALRTGMSYIPQFVLMDKAGEKVLFTPGPLQNEYAYRLRNNKLAYIEYEIDPRWGYRDFGRLRVYDIKKKQHVLDKRETKYRLAVGDHEGEYIAAVEWDLKQGQAIVILDDKGREQIRQPYDKTKVITSLDWINDEELALVLKDQNDQKSLVRFRIRNGRERVLLDPAFINYANVNVSEGKILIESPESGIDNIFVVEDSGARQITSALFGAYAPTVHEGKLYFANYTADGLEVVKKEHPWEEEQKSSGSFVPFYEKFAALEGKEKLDLSAGQEELKVEKYSQVKNAINFHSWAIFAPPLSPTVTLAAFSRDILNKFSLSFGGDWNLNEKTLQGFVNASWSHLYPVFDLRAAYGNRRQDVKVGTNKFENKWEEGTFEAGMQVPWNRLYGRFVQTFTMRAFAKLIKVTNKVSTDIAEVSDGQLFSPGVEIQYSLLSRMARRDLLPRYGFSLNGRKEEGRDITGDSQKGNMTHLEGRFYLPGFDLHHSISQQIAYERQLNNFYEYASLVFYPRGTRSVFLQEFTKYSGNYTMPLAYPDWNWSRYFYLKRLSLNLFYDTLNGRYRNFNYKASSYGWEVLFDTNFLRIALPITWGVRGSYVQEGLEQDQNYEIFLNSLLGVF